MTKSSKHTLLGAALTIVLATLLIQGTAFAAALTFGREKLKGTSKAAGDFSQPEDKSIADAGEMSLQALLKVNDALKTPSLVEKTPQENAKRVNNLPKNPPLDPRVTHLKNAKGLLEKVGTLMMFDNSSPSHPTSQDAQVLTAQAIVKIDDAIKIVVARGASEGDALQQVKNWLAQANQELKLANPKPNTRN